MKKHLLLIIASCFALTWTMNAQECLECEADTSCGAGATFPTTCPEFLPDGVAGEYYEEVITFFIPEEVEFNGITATITEVVVTSITGLPFGMELTFNNNDNTFNPGEGENYGCAILCGVPLLEGNYEAMINVTVTAIAFGLEQTLPQSFPSPLTIIPGEQSNASFSFDNLAGCGSLDVTFNAIIDGAPNPTEYIWNFGNGNSSTAADPEVQAYNTPGDYTVSLETNIFQYVLSQVSVSALSNAGDDIEEGFGLLLPDPYLVVLDSEDNIVFTSDIITDTDIPTFVDLSIILESSAYTIQIWDDDLIDEDDLVATYVLGELSAGSESFVDGDTEGMYTVELQVRDTFTDEETISVFDFPNADLIYNDVDNTLTVEDASAGSYQWTLNGNELLNQVSNSIDLDQPGVYQCLVNNGFGCSTLSDEYIVCPDIEIQRQGDQLFVTSGYLSYAWFINGDEIDGENGNVIAFQGEGNYSVQITTDYGCDIESPLALFTGIGEEKLVLGLDVYPNPVKDELYVSTESLEGLYLLEVRDSSGKLILKEKAMLSRITPYVLNVSEFSQGLFLLTISNKETAIGTRRFSKQ